MVYQWDKDKAATNLNKHGIDFADAVLVFSDDLAVMSGLKKNGLSPSVLMRSVEFSWCTETTNSSVS